MIPHSFIYLSGSVVGPPQDRMKYNKASTLTVCNSHAHLFMDNSTSSTWAISMGNHFLLENLPCELPYSIEDPPPPHQPPPGHPPNSSVQTPLIPPTHSSVKPYHLQSSYHPPIPRVHTLLAPSSSHVSSSSLAAGSQGGDEEEEEEEEGLGPLKEMMYKIAAMQPVDIDPATIRKPKRRNVRISDDPQSVAARHRRERISERIRILQRLVPGGTKMDTASMLDEAIRYVKFLKRQIQELQCNQNSPPIGSVAAMAAGEWPIQPASLGPSSSIRPVGGAAFGFTSDDGTQHGML